jgi:hypothetical protein
MLHPICFVPSSQSQSRTISKSEKSHISSALLYQTFGGIANVKIEDAIRTLFDLRIFATCVRVSICKDFIWSSMHKCGEWIIYKQLRLKPPTSTLLTSIITTRSITLLFSTSSQATISLVEDS